MGNAILWRKKDNSQLFNLYLAIVGLFSVSSRAARSSTCIPYMYILTIRFQVWVKKKMETNFDKLRTSPFKTGHPLDYRSIFRPDNDYMYV